MPNLLKVSEAASLGLHAMALLARDSHKPVTTREIAKSLRASEAHLSKVLQRLTRARMVRATRGPKGGFVLAKAPGRVTLLSIYEAIEGPLAVSHCLLAQPVCSGKCILGNLLAGVGEQVKTHLASTRLSELTDVYGDSHGDRQEDRENRRGTLQRLRPVHNRLR